MGNNWANFSQGCCAQKQDFYLGGKLCLLHSLSDAAENVVSNVAWNALVNLTYLAPIHLGMDAMSIQELRLRTKPHAMI